MMVAIVVPVGKCRNQVQTKQSDNAGGETKTALKAAQRKGAGQIGRWKSQPRIPFGRVIWCTTTVDAVRKASELSAEGPARQSKGMDLVLIVPS